MGKIKKRFNVYTMFNIYVNMSTGRQMFNSTILLQRDALKRSI